MAVGRDLIIFWVRFRSATGYTMNSAMVGTSRGLSSGLHDLFTFCDCGYVDDGYADNRETEEQLFAFPPLIFLSPSFLFLPHVFFRT